MSAAAQPELRSPEGSPGQAQIAWDGRIHSSILTTEKAPSLRTRKCRLEAAYSFFGVLAGAPVTRRLGNKAISG